MDLSKRSDEGVDEYDDDENDDNGKYRSRNNRNSDEMSWTHVTLKDRYLHEYGKKNIFISDVSANNFKK